MKKLILTLIATTASLYYMNAQVSAYPFSASSGTYTPIAGGTVLGSTSDDEEVFVDPASPSGGTSTRTGVGFPIGFNFTYNGQTFDRLAISTNGWISLGKSNLSPAVDITSGAGGTDNYVSVLSQTSTAASPFLRSRIGGLAMDLKAQTGSSLMIQLTGVSPNRVYVIQWTNYKRYSATTGSYNFQIRLKETSNIVEVGYGTFTSGTPVYEAQVGLGGTLPADFNVRKTSTNWASTTAGTANTDTCRISATVVPASGTTFDWTPPPACTGTPTPGTASAPAATCSGVNFDLVLTGYTANVSGLTFQWQSSSTSGGTYTNITNATASTFTTSQTATTYYKCIVTCSGSGSPATSNVIGVTMNAPSLCYCTPVHSSACSSSNNIDSVRIVGTTLANLHTGCTGTNGNAYTIYPATGNTTASLTGATTYVFKVTTTSDNIVSIWIDYNQNGVFDANEWTQVCTTSTANVPNSVSITIPANAVPGITGMRIRSRSNFGSNGSTNACTSFSNGETEDYKVTIIAAPACSGTPTPGTASASVSSVCGSVGFNLILTGYTPGVSGLTFQWKSSATGTTGSFTNIVGATTPTFATSQTAATYYQCVVTCSGSSATSNTIHETINSIASCSCTPPSTDCTDGDVIYKVVIGTINHATMCSTGGYSIDSSVVPIFNRTSTYPIAVSIGDGGDDYVAAWIDYNQNGLFDSAEYTAIGDGDSVTVNGNIIIPATAALGNTMMRVRVRFNTALGASNACLGYTYGETEDYKVKIGSLTGVDENNIGSSNNVVIYPNPTTGMFNIAISNTNFTELIINVFDIQGKEVFNTVDKNISSNYNKQINLEGLAKGLYYIKLNTGNSVKVQKLIIE